MTDAPALVLVPMEPTAKMYSEGLAVVNRALNPPDSVYAAMLSASPYIGGVPVEVVERMAEALFNIRNQGAPKRAWKESKLLHGEYQEAVRTVLRAAGLKVADNG
jgi:hypothetical protein